MLVMSRTELVGLGYLSLGDYAPSHDHSWSWNPFSLKNAKSKCCPPFWADTTDRKNVVLMRRERGLRDPRTGVCHTRWRKLADLGPLDGAVAQQVIDPPIKMSGWLDDTPYSPEEMARRLGVYAPGEPFCVQYGDISCVAVPA